MKIIFKSILIFWIDYCKIICIAGGLACKLLSFFKVIILCCFNNFIKVRAYFTILNISKRMNENQAFLGMTSLEYSWVVTPCQNTTAQAFSDFSCLSNHPSTLCNVLSCNYWIILLFGLRIKYCATSATNKDDDGTELKNTKAIFPIVQIFSLLPMLGALDVH